MPQPPAPDFILETPRGREWFHAAGNAHMHTPYSDGEWPHARIAEAALKAGLDFIIVTDHNVWVCGPEGVLESNGRRLLTLIGEEVHDRTRNPQKNHLLVYGAETELSHLAEDPQGLIDGVRKAGGLCFLAHPQDPEIPLFHEPDLSWVSWEVSGYAGIEIWNYMSEFKSLMASRWSALRYAYNPELGIRGPFPEVLKKWDELLSAGQRVVGIGGADAHGTLFRLGPLQRVLFPYEFLFRAVNTHVFTPEPLTGDYGLDRFLVLRALRQGNCYTGYDMAAPTRGFRFTAQGQSGCAIMGDETEAKLGTTLQILAPRLCKLRLIHNGKVVGEWAKRTHASYVATEPGAYRVEARLPYMGKEVGWIFSNPIYVRA